MKLSHFIPKFVKDAFNIIISKPVTEIVITHSRKKPDRTKFTTEQIDLIKFFYRNWKEQTMLPEIKTQREFVNFLNHEFNLNKGVTTYAKIWSPKIKPQEA